MSAAAELVGLALQVRAAPDTWRRSDDRLEHRVAGAAGVLAHKIGEECALCRLLARAVELADEADE